jgi:TatD DNase family protein
MELIDTHCHIHSLDYPLAADQVITRAELDDVTRLLCVGQTPEDSRQAVSFVQTRDGTWASIGIHPHEAKAFVKGNVLDTEKFQEFAELAEKPKVVAVGECGLDFFYNHSAKEAQIIIIKSQIELALKHNLPMVFHVREAFEDFWPIFDTYHGIRGVVHSFSAADKELADILQRGLYVGLNGIMTFTKDQAQLAAAKAVPLDRLLLETDAPYLTPTPYRGTINEPKNVRVTAEFLANLRGESLEKLAAATTRNARKLFAI